MSVTRIGWEGFASTSDTCLQKLPASILAAVQLPLRPSMSVEDVIHVLGFATDTADGAPGCVVLDFECGAEDRYHVRCYFTDGLHGVDIMRMDLLQKHDHDT